MENKQTAVEWLIAQVNSEQYQIAFGQTYISIDLIEQAKQMEKEQIQQCWDTAHQAGRFEGKGIAEENWQTFEQYYNETYGK